MSKIICDVCGTSYPESATQCPICGCVRPGDANTVSFASSETESKPNGTYTYVKGGRFSKSNVKKRNQGLAASNADPVVTSVETDKSEEKKSDKGFVIAVILLLAAIVAVVIYIALRFFVPALTQDGGNTADTTPSTTEQTQGTTGSALEIPCDEVLLSKTAVEFDRVGAAIFMNATVYPADTTDKVQFSSSDDSVATVDANGRVVAVGPGEAVIIVSCGTAEATCQVTCNFESSDTTDTTEATEATTEPTTATVDFALNREDFTLSKKGDTWTLYTGDIPVDQITWYSDDDSVATIKDGVVTAVGGGYTTVYGEYQGVKCSCVVRCGFATNDDNPQEGNTTESDNAPSQTYSISHTDVTIQIGETFSLILSDERGNAVAVNWNVTDSSICSVSGNIVKGLSSGQTTVSVTYNGATYSCVVRVK